MSHHLDRSVGSDLSWLVFEKRRKQGELHTPSLDSTNQRLYPLPSHLVQREAFAADRENIPDSFQGEARRLWEGK